MENLSIREQTKRIRDMGKDAYKMMLGEGLTVADVAKFYGTKESLVVACIRTANSSAVVSY